MKTKQELEQELSEEEITQINGGSSFNTFEKEEGPGNYEYNMYDISSDIEKKKDEFKKKF